MRPTIPLLALALLAGCRTTPPGSPAEVGTGIVTALDEGRKSDADRLFDRSEDHDGYREKMYPILFDAAQERWDLDDAIGAVALLDFMSEHYPDSGAVSEALVYALAVQSAQMRMNGEVPPEVARRTDEALERLEGASEPIWLDLLRAQHAIDKEDLDEARAAMERFEASWDGEPNSLALYVHEIDRYLGTH